MANRILLQTLLKFSDQIKSGAAKVQDVIIDYVNQTGKSVTNEERGIILKEFQDNAPSNVTTLEGVDPRETIMPTGIDSTSLKDNLMKTDNPFSDLVKTTEEGPKTLDQRRAEAEGVKLTAKPISGKINYPEVEKQLGVKLRGNETFDELLEIEKNTKEKNQGLGSLFPKGETDSIFDIKNDKRMEVAEFMRAMRAAGIKNEDVMNVAKNPDIAEGKRAATTLARAADMGADTKIKQELLGTLDEDIATNSPRFFQEEYMGYDSMGNLLENISTTVNNGIYDDLLDQGVPEDKVSEIFRYISRIRDNVKYDPKALLRKIADDIEMENIKYDTTFWDNYIDEILTRIQKPAPRFADGGLV